MTSRRLTYADSYTHTRGRTRRRHARTQRRRRVRVPRRHLGVSQSSLGPGLVSRLRARSTPLQRLAHVCGTERKTRSGRRCHRRRSSSAATTHPWRSSDGSSAAMTHERVREEGGGGGVNPLHSGSLQLCSGRKLGGVGLQCMHMHCTHPTHAHAHAHARHTWTWTWSWTWTHVHVRMLSWTCDNECTKVDQDLYGPLLYRFYALQPVRCRQAVCRDSEGVILHRTSYHGTCGNRVD